MGTLQKLAVAGVAYLAAVAAELIEPSKAPRRKADGWEEETESEQLARLDRRLQESRAQLREAARRLVYRGRALARLYSVLDRIESAMHQEELTNAKFGQHVRGLMRDLLVAMQSDQAAQQECAAAAQEEARGDLTLPNDPWPQSSGGNDERAKPAPSARGFAPSPRSKSRQS